MINRKKVGNLIRILMDWDCAEMAKKATISYNSLQAYEADRFNSKHLDNFYNYYYEKLHIEQILINTGTSRAFNRLEEYLGGK